MIARAILVCMALLAITPGRAVDAQQPRPYFTDVASRSQFNYVTRNDYRRRKYFIQPLAGGVAILDYDNDGRMDIFFTNGAELPSMKKPAAFANALLRNRGAGMFEDRTSAAGLAGGDSGYHIGAAAGDYDNDGYTDLFLANAGSNTLLRNNRDGTFTDATAGSGISKPPNTLSVGAAWFDYDNDRLLDLVVSDYTIWTPETDYQCADSSKREIYCSPTRYVSVPNRLYHNLGNGKFEDVTEQSGLAEARGKGMGVSIADVNNDNLPDIFIVNDTERNFLFINQGAGRFREQGAIYGVSFNDDGVAVNGMGSDAKDFNNDGFVDLFYNDLATQVFALFAGDRGKSFRYVSYSTGLGRLSYRFGGWGAGFIDYDNDGWKDLYSANGDVDYLGDNAKQSDTMFRNLDGKSFADVSAAMGVAFTRQGLPSGLGVFRSQRRRIARHCGDRPQRTAANSHQCGNAWRALAASRPAGHTREPRRHRREGQGHDRFGTHAAQPRVGVDRVDVVLRSSRSLRPGARECDLLHRDPLARRPGADIVGREGGSDTASPRARIGLAV